MILSGTMQLVKRFVGKQARVNPTTGSLATIAGMNELCFLGDE